MYPIRMHMRASNEVQMTAHVSEIATECRGRIPFAERPTCSVDDAVQASGLSRSSLYEAMRAGELDFVKIGHRRLVIVPSLLKMLGTGATA